MSKKIKDNKKSLNPGEIDGFRNIPESRAAEAAVLGSMILDPVCIPSVLEQIRTEAFYRSEHQLIFDAITAVYEGNKTGNVDGVLLREELEKRNQLELVGGLDYLTEIVQSVPSSANCSYYLDIVKDKMLLRQLVQAATDILSDAYDPTGETKGKIDGAEQKIFAVTHERVSSSASPLKDLVVSAYEAIEARDGSVITGIPTGFFELDQMTCGLQKGDLIIVAGRPSMGKTSFALNIAEHAAIKENKAVAIFSLEMGKEQLAERILCGSSGVETQLVRRGLLEASHYQKLAEASHNLANTPIYIDDTAGLTPLEVRAKARRLKSRYGISCVFIDYLQLMSLGTSKIESRQQEITTISRYLKSLARELEVPVVVLSQLNRAAETRENHRPRMSDLRESGSIEQDADVIMLLHRQDYYNKNEPDFVPDNSAELIVAKQRNGPTGSIPLIFIEKLTKFENMASHVEEPF